MRRVLCIVPDDVREPGPGAFREREAAKYVRMNINDFRKAVKEGLIPFRIRSIQRLYLKKDLDDYLEALPVGGEETRISPKPFTSGKGGEPCQ